MRSVSPGEPILPALTAEWYNHTIKQHPSSPGNGPQTHRHQNEILAVFNPDGEYTEVNRFDPVAITNAVDTTNYINRSCYVNIASLDEYNWIIPQAAMREGQYSQPCVYTGLTFANVNLTNANHRYVSLDKSTKTLKSAFNGKGLILTRNPTGPSLISIEGDIGVRLVRFELLGSMFGGGALADIYDVQGGHIETAVVGDPLRIFDTLDTGNDGLAIRQNGQYYAVQAPCPVTGEV